MLVFILLHVSEFMQLYDISFLFYNFILQKFCFPLHAEGLKIVTSTLAIIDFVKFDYEIGFVEDVRHAVLG